MLGERVERTRLLHNIPQSELAVQAGISPRTLRRLESGASVSLESFVNVLTALGLDSNLPALIPDHSVRPMERARQSNAQRQRASKSNAKNAGSNPAGNNEGHIPKGKAKPWTWGDEQS